MIDREKVIKEYEDFVNRYISVSVNDDYVLEMHKAVLALLKEQKQQICELQDKVEYLTDKQKEQEIGLCDRCGRRRLKSKWEGR